MPDPRPRRRADAGGRAGAEGRQARQGAGRRRSDRDGGLRRPVRARDRHRQVSARCRLPRRGDRGGRGRPPGRGRNRPRCSRAAAPRAALPRADRIVLAQERDPRRRDLRPRRGLPRPDVESDPARTPDRRRLRRRHRPAAPAGSARDDRGGVRLPRRRTPAALGDPVAGLVVKGGVAYGGTRALGETAMRYFEAVSRSVDR